MTVFELIDKSSLDEKEKEKLNRKIYRVIMDGLCDGCCSIRKQMNLRSFTEDEFRRKVLELLG
jgi:hypothetical protein